MEEDQESLRYGYLKKCLDNFAKSHRDKPGSCKRLAKSFPELFQSNQEALKLISDSFGNKYQNLFTESIEEVLKNTEIKEKLAELEKCVEVDSECAWRPSCDPAKDLKAYIATSKQDEILMLEQELLKAENELQSQRGLLNQKKKTIQGKLLHVNSIAEEVVSASHIAQSNSEIFNQLLNAAKE